MIQIDQALQIGAKYFQIGAAPVVTNRSNSYYKSWQLQLLQVWAKLLQLRTVITNWGRIIINRGRFCKLKQLLQIGPEHPCKIHPQEKHDSLHFLTSNIFGFEENFYLQRIRSKHRSCLQLLMSL